MFAKGAMAFIQNAGRSDRDVKPVARRSGFIQSVRKMEQACFKEMNRLVRTRMLGGVGGARRKPAPIPIAMLSDVLVLCYTFRRMQANCELRLNAWRGTLFATKKPKKFAD